MNIEERIAQALKEAEKYPHLSPNVQECRAFYGDCEALSEMCMQYQDKHAHKYLKWT